MCASSVVTYPVIIEADNPSGKLFPGMTANISVHIAEARGVLAVSSAAFRYHPPAAGGPGAGVGPHAGDKSKKTLWLLGAGGEPEAVEVGTGLSDGSVTQIKGDAALEGRWGRVSRTARSRKSRATRRWKGARRCSA